MSSRMFKKQTATVTLLVKFLYQMQVPFVPLRITGSKKDYSDVLVLVAAIGDKVNLLVASKTKDIHAGNLVKELAPIVDGRGGGKPDMAMAGGSNQAKIQELLDAVAGKL